MPGKRKPEPLRIIQITDLHLQGNRRDGLGWCRDCESLDTTETLQTVLDDIQINEPWFDALVVTGDIAQDGEAAAYERFARLLAREGAPVYCIPGNHDDKQLMRNALDGETVSMPRHVVHGGWQLLFLDSCCQHSDKGEISAIQLAWIEAMVARLPTHHAILFMHHHPVPVGSHWLDTHHGMINGEAALESLAKLPQLKAVVFGHIHQQLDSWHGHLRILGTPSTCLQFQPASAGPRFSAQAPAYRRIALHANGEIETEVVFSHQPWHGGTAMRPEAALTQRA